MLQRLQKILAQAGIASRRAAEQIIRDGRVQVNGRVVTTLGTRADPRRDRIVVDGQRISLQSPVYLLLHKPRTVVSTMNDPEGRPTVADYVARLPVRVYPVGRLDFNTSGALLLTNDGEFAARMLHPRHHVPKTYLVKLRGEMKAEDLKPWREGVMLDDGMTKPAEAFVVKQAPGYTWIELILQEGRNQQIRRMGEATGFPVSRLTRLSFAGISIDGLRAGQWRLLTTEELRNLKEAYGVPKRIGPAIESHRKLVPLQTADHARVRAASKTKSSRPRGLARRDADQVDRPSGPQQGQGHYLGRRQPAPGVAIENEPPRRSPRRRPVLEQPSEEAGKPHRGKKKRGAPRRRDSTPKTGRRLRRPSTPHR